MTAATSQFVTAYNTTLYYLHEGLCVYSIISHSLGILLMHLGIHSALNDAIRYGASVHKLL